MIKLKNYRLLSGWVNLAQYVAVLGKTSMNVDMYAIAVGKKYGLVLLKKG